MSEVRPHRDTESMILERVRVEFRGEIPGHPDVETEVVQLLSETADGDVFEAIAGYAKMLGLAASYFLGQQVMIVELYLPLVP